MPGVNPDNSNLLPHYLAQMNNRIRALETQQQLIISNLKGQPVIAFGLQPGSNPAEYGMGLLRQTFGSKAAFFGESATGAVGIKFYGTTGKVLIEVNGTGLTGFAANGTSKLMALTDQSMTFYTSTGKPLIELNDAGLTGYAADGTTPLVALTDAGLAVENTAGVQEVQLGKQIAGNYGLAVRGPTGAMQQVGGVGHGYVQTAGAGETTTSTAWTTLATAGPTVTCTVGSSGLALITMAAYMELTAQPTNGGGVYAGVRIDSTTPGGVGSPRLTFDNAAKQGAGTGPGGTFSLSYMATGLSAGSHTFTMRYQVLSGTTGLYQTRTLVVQPL